MTSVSTHTIAPTQALELRQAEGLWHFQLFERGTELWYARHAGMLISADAEQQAPIHHTGDAVDAACFLLAERVRDVDLLIQVVGFDATVRPDGSLRLEAPGIGEIRDLRDEPQEEIQLPLLMHVHLNDVLPPGDPRNVNDVYFTTRVAPGLGLQVPRPDAPATSAAALGQD